MTTESAAVNAEPKSPNGLKKGSIGIVAVIFMAVANAAPITAMTGNVPIAVGFGNGLGAEFERVIGCEVACKIERYFRHPGDLAHTPITHAAP